MLAVRFPSQQRFLLDSVPWDRYTKLLHVLADRHLRITYDRGVLEIMTLSHEHESLTDFLGRMVVTLTEELDLPLHPGRSTTLRRRRKQKGLEPDNCYWIANAAAVRAKKRINLRTDPPPDLALEVDVSRSSLNRMGIYAKLRVPELWRCDAQGLSFFTLGAQGEYAAASISAVFPIPITPADLWAFIGLRGQIDDNIIIRQFREWIRSRIASTHQP